MVNERTSDIAVIDVDDKNALPRFRTYVEIVQAIESGSAKVLPTDRYLPPVLSEADLRGDKYQKFIKRRDKAHAIVGPLFSGENALSMLFEKSARS
jgi:hypothetical protein